MIARPGAMPSRPDRSEQTTHEEFADGHQDNVPDPARPFLRSRPEEGRSALPSSPQRDINLIAARPPAAPLRASAVEPQPPRRILGRPAPPHLAVDVLACPRRGGRMRVIAGIDDR